MHPQQDCDVSPMKQQLQQQLELIAMDIQHSLKALDDENYCLLSEFAQVREAFTKIESLASAYYLNCYLSPYTDNYMDLSIAIRHLSERRHGALIVIQRADPLDSLIQSGTPVGAALSYSLLESIFYPGSPLHDGAVLIRSNQLISAANVLPLSKIAAGEKKLGTRHRAALGLSESSDALVLVVSEETGLASFAMRGKLYPINAVHPFVAPVLSS